VFTCRPIRTSAGTGKAILPPSVGAARSISSSPHVRAHRLQALDRLIPVRHLWVRDECVSPATCVATAAGART